MRRLRRLAPALRFSAAIGDALWSMGRLSITRRPEALLSPWCRRFLRQLSLDVRLDAPIPGGGQLWVANHLSWLDPVVLLALRPSGVLAKAEVADYPVIGLTARRTGLHFVQREAPLSRAAALAGMASELRSGRDFLLFPEGTTTRGETLAPFYEGGLRLAYRLGINTVPLRLSSVDPQYPWTGDEELVSHLRRLWKTPRTRLRVAPGALLRPSEFPDEEAWLRRIREALHPWTATEEIA